MRFRPRIVLLAATLYSAFALTGRGPSSGDTAFWLVGTELLIRGREILTFAVQIILPESLKYIAPRRYKTAMLIGTKRVCGQKTPQMQTDAKTGASHIDKSRGLNQ